MGQFLGEEVMHLMRGMDRMGRTFGSTGGTKSSVAQGVSGRTLAELVFRPTTRRLVPWTSAWDCFR